LSYGQAKNDQTQTIEHALKQQPLLNAQAFEQPVYVDPDRVASTQFISDEVWILTVPVGFFSKRIVEP